MDPILATVAAQFVIHGVEAAPSGILAHVTPSRCRLETGFAGSRVRAWSPAGEGPAVLTSMSLS